VEHFSEQLALLDAISEEIKRDHELRLDVCDDIPLRRRGRRIRKRARTAIISRAAEESRKWKERDIPRQSVTVTGHSRAGDKNAPDEAGAQIPWLEYAHIAPSIPERQPAGLGV
jgi:hypothetical protein